MKNKDGRKLTQETQEELRMRSVKLVLLGRTHEEVSEVMGFRRQVITKWYGKYKEGGFKALKKQTRGRRLGGNRRLSMSQESRTKQLIKDKTPDQLKLGFALWSRQAVSEVIEQEFGIKLPIRTMGEYLKRWGYTPQKPLKKAYEQQTKAVKKWLKESYPAILKKAKTEKAEIHWGDETGINNQPNVPRGYAPKGKTPVLTRLAKRFSSSMISTITNQGTLRFMIYDGALNTDKFKKFLTQLIKVSPHKVILIVDNLRVHHAKKLKPWLEEHSKKIELFFLPSYSPEKNPDEYLNQDLKGHLRNKPMSKSKKEMNSNLSRYMKSLQKTPKKIINFFNHKEVQYAKAI
jgi:transposase